MAGGHVLKEGFETLFHAWTHRGGKLTVEEAKESAQHFGKEAGEKAEKEAAEAAQKTGKEAGEDATKQGAKEGVERLTKDTRKLIRDTEKAIGKTAEYEARSARVIGEGENAVHLTEAQFKKLEQSEEMVKKYDNALHAQETYGKPEHWEWDEAKQVYNPKEGGPAGREPISKAEFENITNADEVIKSAESEEFKSAKELNDAFADMGGSKAAKETTIYENPSKLDSNGDPVRLTQDQFDGLGMMERAYKEDNADLLKTGFSKISNGARNAYKNNPFVKKGVNAAAFLGVGLPVGAGVASWMFTGNPMAAAETVGGIYDGYGKVAGAASSGLGAVGNFIGEHPWVLALGAGALAVGVLGGGSVLGNVAKLGIGAVAIGFLVSKGSELMGNMVADKEGTTAKLENALGMESEDSASTTAQNSEQNKVVDENASQYVKVDTTTVDTSQYQQASQGYSVV